MAWQNLHISQSGSLSLKRKNLYFKSEAGENSFALEDIACIILDTKQINLSAALLSRLSEDGIMLIVPDERHHPAGMVLSFHQHYAQAEIAHLQANLSTPLKKRLWQKIIKRKIRNQGRLLENQNLQGGKKLLGYADLVKSGDSENMEAVAARFYWRNLFQNFIRADGTDFRNSLLNYGYAIVRAMIARSIAASGLLPAFGLFHISKLNPFNLADDLIEPYRPFVDGLALKRFLMRSDIDPAKSMGQLDLEDRRFMANILNFSIEMKGEIVTLLTATEIMSASLVTAIREKTPDSFHLPAWGKYLPLIEESEYLSEEECES
ncbi:type II CRISPR-associated endonuclease Cas1 [Acetobacteraceae bacterium]|nr:type II CRISPR-associated endonuclease Cas1 [Acetobacteraceae bacterium]